MRELMSVQEYSHNMLTIFTFLPLFCLLSTKNLAKGF